MLTHRLQNHSRRVAFVTLLLVVCALLIIGLHIASADSQCQPVNGHSVTQVVPPPDCTSPVGLCTAGKVFGGLQGDLTLTAASIVPTGNPTIPTVLFFTGTSVITANNGDTLVGTDAGAIDQRDGTVATLITWISGTGQYTGASGHIRVSANLDAVTGTVTSDYRGEVCTP